MMLLGNILLGLALAGILWIVALSLTISTKKDLEAIRRYASEHGWVVLYLERGYSGRLEPTRYYLRYRDRDDAVYEALIVRDFTAPIQLLRAVKLPDDVARAMTDLTMEMDCRKCGATIPKHSARCPYCNAARDHFGPLGPYTMTGLAKLKGSP